MSGGHGPTLDIQEAVRTTFREACSTREHRHRWIQFIINGPNETIELGETGTPKEDGKQEFQDMLEASTQNGIYGPCFFVLRDSDSEFWTFITFVPTDSTKPKLKMLYPTAKEGLKKELGNSWFSKDYQATEADEMTYEAFTEWKESNSTATPTSLLTERERIKQEERMNSGMSRNSSSSAMNVVEYGMEASLAESLVSIKEKKSNHVVIAVENDKQKFFRVSVGTESAKDAINRIVKESIIDKDKGYYMLIRSPDDTEGTDALYLIQYCPDTLHARSKMILSTGKASLTEKLKHKDLTVTKHIQAFDEDELADLFPSKVENGPTQDGGSSTPQGEPTEEPKIAKKPKRPGRGKARLIR
eukprot:gb/GECG01001445.1/.p1 GENE.gb/GECG01001445.1/~~gb/GECG01001445.1/.p1  ORF type:complete len:359 (+),score=54.30 gb/GECG01001445.1/:1-1077(+)